MSGNTPLPHTIEVRRLGRIKFEEALALQEQLVANCIASEARGPGKEVLLLLEHDPVYTIGRTADQTSLRNAARLPHPVVQINRGGQATYHGPGQLVGYPILDLKVRGQDLHRYLRDLEEVLIDALAEFEIAASRRAGLTGVWVGQRKIASIGVGVRHWISMHGFALNVCGDLTPFSEITPCGIVGVEMTSVEKETGRSVELWQVAERVSAAFLKRFAGSASETTSAP